MRRKSVNTHILSHGGDRTTLYPHAKQWEGIDAARAREQKTQNISPITQAETLLSHLQARFWSLWEINGSRMKTKDTRKKVIALIELIANIPENSNVKENLSTRTKVLIEDFERRGHKINIKNPSHT